MLSFCGRALAIGECGAQFLKMGVGARACGMGEAYTSIADDATAIYWNPAGLGQVDRLEFTGMQNFWLLDMSHQYLALAVPLAFGTIGVSGAYSSSGTLDRYENFQKTGEFTAYDAAGTVGYGLRAGPVRVGLSAKYIQSKIDDKQAQTVAGDAGVLCRFETSSGYVGLGLAVQNVGPGLEFVEKSDPLPLNLKLGLAAKIGQVVLAVDANKPRDNSVRLGAGAEVVIAGLLALRGGYNMASGLTAGGGVTWKMVSVDYAFVPYSGVDATHRISVRVRFDPNPASGPYDPSMPDRPTMW